MMLYVQALYAQYTGAWFLDYGPYSEPVCPSECTGAGCTLCVVADVHLDGTTAVCTATCVGLSGQVHLASNTSVLRVQG